MHLCLLQHPAVNHCSNLFAVRLQTINKLPCELETDPKFLTLFYSLSTSTCSPHEPTAPSAGITWADLMVYNYHSMLSVCDKEDFQGI